MILHTQAAILSRLEEVRLRRDDPQRGGGDVPASASATGACGGGAGGGELAMAGFRVLRMRSMQFRSLEATAGGGVA